MIIVYSLIAALSFFLITRAHKNRLAIVYRYHWLLSLRLISVWRVNALESEIARQNEMILELQRLLGDLNKLGKAGQLGLPIDTKSIRQHRIIAPSGNGVSYSVNRADLLKSESGLIKIEREYWQDHQGKKQKRQITMLWIAESEFAQEWTKDSQGKWYRDTVIPVIEVISN